MPTNQPSAENVKRARAINAKVAEYLGPNLEFHHFIAVAQALDEAERRGAVKELRRDGGFRNRLNKAFTGTVFGESQWEKGMSAGLTVAVTVCDDYANELESATKETGV
jgi:hypothetical protein